jgi:hypothetical protein
VAANREKVDANELMTQAEAAKARGVTLASINELVQRKRLRVVEMFGKKLVYRSEVEGFAKLKSGPKIKAGLSSDSTDRKPNRKPAAKRKQTDRKPRANRKQTNRT